MNNLQDAILSVTHALPSAASSSVTTPDLDLGSNQGNAGSDFPGDVEVVINVPALTTAMLPDGDTLTLQLQSGASAGPTTAYEQPIVITGAGGAGNAGTTRPSPYRFRLQANIARYLNLKATSGAGTGNMSTVSIELALAF